MFKEIRQGILFTMVTLVLIGGAYNVLLWAIGRSVFARQAEGSLIRRGDGTIVGSRLIAQKFTRPDYFHPRPSGVDYNAAATGGTVGAEQLERHPALARAPDHSNIASP